jgi:hypothetical protein
MSGIEGGTSEEQESRRLSLGMCLSAEELGTRLGVEVPPGQQKLGEHTLKLLSDKILELPPDQEVTRNLFTSWNRLLMESH